MTAALDQTCASLTLPALRREIYAKSAVSRADLSQVLRLDRIDSADEYARLLADVATDLLVNQPDPPKYVVQMDVDWLIGEIAASKVAYGAEIQMLTEVIRLAVSVPSSLVGFCVSEIEKAIVCGREGHPAGVIAKEDTQALRAAVFAAVDGDSLHVSRSSAEGLFRIAHAAKNANDPEFDEFFAKAISNYLMGIAFRWTPSREDELEKERWLDEKPTGFPAFLAAMFRADANANLSAKTADEVDDARLREEDDADAHEIATASEIDPAETDWLITHLSRSGALTSAERALLAFLQREAPSLPTRLAALA
jgi:hypothetical protein